MEKLPTLRVSHCQTALFGKRGGGSGGGGLTVGTSSREERSEAAEMRETTSQACLPGQAEGGQRQTNKHNEHYSMQDGLRKGLQYILSSYLHNNLTPYSLFSSKCVVH